MLLEKRAFITLRTDRICRSHTPPKLLAFAGFFIQSIPSLSKSAFILSSSISSTAFFSSFSAPIKLVPRSLRSSLTAPLRQMNQRRACMNESVSIECATSICMARLAIHVNSAPYRLTSFLPSLTYHGPK